MQVLIVFALIAASQATVLLGGASEQYRSQDGHGNYAFGYNEGHGSGSTFRKESGDGHGNVAGSYGLRDADGRQRIVNYVADAAGFRADIKTNEPGVEPKDPANTAINKAAILPAVHAPISYAAAPHLAPAAAAVHYTASHPVGGAFAYNTAIGHHGYANLGYHGLGHHGFGHHGLAHPGQYGYYY